MNFKSIPEREAFTSKDGEELSFIPHRDGWFVWANNNNNNLKIKKSGKIFLVITFWALTSYHHLTFGTSANKK